MRRSRFTKEQILRILELSERGDGVSAICRAHAISRRTFYRWRLISTAKSDVQAYIARARRRLDPYKQNICKALQCEPDHVVFRVIPNPGGDRLTIETEYGYERFELRFHKSYFGRHEMQRLLYEFSANKKVLLAAKHISRRFGEQLSQKGVAFVDLAGNMNLVLTDHDAGHKKRCCLHILGKPPRRRGPFEGAAQTVVTEVV